MVPRDPQILASYINTQLRDNYANLEDLCRELSLDKKKLIQKLGSIEYCYDAAANRFV